MSSAPQQHYAPLHGHVRLRVGDRVRHDLSEVDHRLRSIDYGLGYAELEHIEGGKYAGRWPLTDLSLVARGDGR